MRISQYSNPVSTGTNASSRKIGNITLPDFSDFHYNTKSAPAMSDDKYKEAIIAQAKKDQAAGVFQSGSAGFRSLVKSYVSAVSPDRKGMITEGLTAVFKNSAPTTKTMNLINYLLGNVKYNKEAEKDLSYAEFYDSNGDMVATFSNTGWTFYGTSSEVSRETELCMIYNEAWNNAAKGAVVADSGADNGGSIDVSV